MVTSTRASATLAASPLIWALECVRLPGPRGAEPFRPYSYQATLLADRAPRQLILKSRQVGVTTVAAIRVLHEAIHAPRSLSLIISRDLVAAQNVIRIILDILSELDNRPRLIKDNQSEIVLENGSRIISQPATERSGRGYTATSVTLDEFAFCEYDERIYRAVSPTLSRGGRLTVLSTPSGQSNLFYQLWQGMEGGDWSRHRIHWKECPAFGDAWYERERPRYSNEAWASEFDLDFIASGGAAFDPDDVDAMRDGWGGLQPPEEGRRYISGWDIGRRRDPTVGITLDITELPYQVVAFSRLVRAQYAQSAAAIDSTAAEYGEAVVESNSIGDPLIEMVEAQVRPFNTSQRTKANALQRLVRLVEQGVLKCGVDQVLSELKSYQWEDKGIVQDCVMALAIALADQRDGAGGLIFPFSGANVTEDAAYVPGKGFLYLSYRWGFNDSTHVCIVQQRGGMFHVFDELVGTGRSERAWVGEIVALVTALPGYKGPTLEEWRGIWAGKKPWPNPWPRVWPHAVGDPDAVQMRTELKEIGIAATPPDRARHGVEQGQDVLRAAIASGRLLVHPCCEETIRHLSNYRAKERIGGGFESVPDPGPANQIFAPGCESLQFLMWRLRRTLNRTNGQ